MSDVSGITNNILSNINSMELKRFKPEPQSRLLSGFNSIVQGISKAAKSAMSYVSNVDPIASEANYSDLLNKQIEMQEQMQVVSMASNIEKSKHETQMAAIRNIRVG